MDINDIVMISIYNYVSIKELTYEEMYDKLCKDIALYIENNIVPLEFDVDNEITKQLIMHFLSLEMNLDKFIQLEQQIMTFIFNDNILLQEEKEYNIAKSHEIIQLYNNMDQTQLIVDILNKINLKQKRKSR